MSLKMEETLKTTDVHKMNAERMQNFLNPERKPDRLNKAWSLRWTVYVRPFLVKNRLENHDNDYLYWSNLIKEMHWLK